MISDYERGIESIKRLRLEVSLPVNKFFTNNLSNIIFKVVLIYILNLNFIY